MAQFPDFQIPFPNLIFERNVTITITAHTEGYAQFKNPYHLTFTTPSCEELRNDDNRVICGKTIVFFAFQTSVGCSR